MGLFDFLKRKKNVVNEEKITDIQKAKNEPISLFSEDNLMAIIEPSKTSFIKIEASVESNLPILTSKFLGKPYLPIGFPYPIDKDGSPMVLLAQINFSETPKLQDYPESGILQFYISPTNDFYGANFDNLLDQSYFRVIFHESVNEKNIKVDLPNFDYQSNDWCMPITAEHKLTFSLGEEFINGEDFRFKKFFGADYYDFRTQNSNDELWDKYSQIANAEGHKIGGYAYFTQYDPRNDNYEDYILLLQIDSVGDEICWGDIGVAGLFITRENLKNKDFSKILYNWDCC